MSLNLSGKEQPRPSIRNAGILLHITSLPGDFGIGDMGPEARKFADFLNRSKQRYWQLLPLNPVGAEQSYSPYSSISSMAGNTLLISPEQLVLDGLIKPAEIKSAKVKPTDKVDWRVAQDSRRKIFRIAYQNFNRNKKLLRTFEQFCERENYWLNDFALYLVLKEHHSNKAWYVWPRPYRKRNARAIHSFSRANDDTIRYVKWQQFIFFHQWNLLKKYCNQLGIYLFGDLPFYVSYDSADVWSHTEIFNVNQAGKMTGVAGVPPDYFNDNGQLWGMPTFKWDILKDNKYNWWIQRIRKNMEMYDRLRLDHFRAFADYWEVPANHATAKRGRWKPGPGADFFTALKKTFGHLPFVAEDLGDINEAVYKLRDDFKLPGMKVLQFAFGDTMPNSDYAPHNYTSNFIVYTGTHDNNTTKGWYRKNTSTKERRQLEKYFDKMIDENNISYELSRLAYATVANTVILPLQDVLGLDERARINTPASTKNNWQWRMNPSALTSSMEKQLATWVILFNRL